MRALEVHQKRAQMKKEAKRNAKKTAKLPK